MAMETDSAMATAGSFAVNSYETALCLVPPSHLWQSIERLRALYDKAWLKWPPHVNVVYPFVRPESLMQACEQITLTLQSSTSTSIGPFDLCLDSVDMFRHKQGDGTIFLCDGDSQRVAKLCDLRDLILKSLGKPTTQEYRMHMSIAQSDDVEGSVHHFTAQKVKHIPQVEWQVGELHILIRERRDLTESPAHTEMKLWGTIDLQSMKLMQLHAPVKIAAKVPEYAGDLNMPGDAKVRFNPAFVYSQERGKWLRGTDKEEDFPDRRTPERLAVANYNVLAEFLWPPSRQRYPVLVANILAGTALADILVLEEVTDDFLPVLLAHPDIRCRYTYVSHGPPDQDDIDPFPSHLNSVVLSRYPFSWSYLSLKRRHKGSIIAAFQGIGKHDSPDDFFPLILATCHLSQGLTDGAVVAKKNELQAILNHLSERYENHPWILAGDFNISTSSYTIDAARDNMAISAQTATYLSSIETMLVEAKLLDAWVVARVENGESSDDIRRQRSIMDAYEGEQGATFDPTENPLAFKLVGSGYNNRPQRYDRILVKGESVLRITAFNMFGFLTEPTTGSSASEPLIYGSDHWGIRCLISIGDASEKSASDSIQPRVAPVQLLRAPPSLAEQSLILESLRRLGGIPTVEDEDERRRVLDTLQRALLGADAGQSEIEASNSRAKVQMILVPVGSYGLGVWTGASDVDCLCIGNISSKTFFALAVQRLRKASAQGVKVIRKVKANSGRMLELEVNEVKVDLQYCPATNIVESWPQVMRRPASDPAFSLPTQTLLKLKPARDLFYMRRSIPDLAQFRVVFQLLKAWAKERGIYSSKFGYLGGIHMSVMLVRVCKILLHDGGAVSVPDMIVTFFNHYATFNWAEDVVYDPFFHKKLRYHRTFREPMCLLGWHAPSLNTATNASGPTVRAIASELKRANELLLGGQVSWAEFLGVGAGDGSPQRNLPAGAADFLRNYKSFVKLSVSYWGPSLQKGSQFVGWLESRCVAMLVDIGRKVPALVARIWPARFVDPNQQGEDSGHGDYQGHYLVGLEFDGGSHDQTRESVRAARGMLQGVLERFVEQIQSDEKYYKPSSSWVSATVVNATDLGPLAIDSRSWGQHDEEDEDSDLDGGEEDEDEEDGIQLDTDVGPASGTSARARGQIAGRIQKPEGGAKLRTALDVMNRLRWDPGLDSGDYIVGYDDRFLGVREKPLDQWKSEQTDEEFIPQHRILYFKRKSDGEIIWDRRSRVDTVFGSGG